MKYSAFLIFLSFLAGYLTGQIQNDPVFTESEIMLETSTGDISGTLTVPGKVQSSPVVLIVAGSGPTDRDCNSPLGISTNAYKMLAEGFAENGISTLRFDKRGIGKSSKAMTSEADLRFETYISDVVSWLALLQKDKRFSSVFILGHSEGSLIGMVAAGQTNAAGFISVAGLGTPADALLQEQLKGKLPPQLTEESDRIIESLREGRTVSEVSPALAAIYRPGVQPYLISWIKYDPAKEISKLTVPVLLVQGTADLQVLTNHVKILSASKPDAKLLILDNMNHVLKESDQDIQKNMATYTNPGLPLKPGLINGIVGFIKTTL